ncbi:hypothetical protein AAU61_07610 [Desulfocarbo indianensis]|nr:hypothetical protein AAU61_07610 [Desulfocarbo indianensis]
MIAHLLMALLLAALALPGPAMGGGGELRLSGPPVAQTLALLAMADQGRLPGTGLSARFTPWRSPDQLRAQVAGEQTDAVLVTIATAAVLRARQVPCRVLAVMAPPVWLVTSQPGAAGLAELAGREIMLPFGPGEMPALLLATVAEKQGVKLGTRQAGGALEAVNLLIMGRAQAALLSEPAASLALARASMTKGGRALYKSVDLRRSWARAFPASPLLATTALVMVGQRARQPEVCQAVAAAFRGQCGWVTKHPAQAEALADKMFPALAGQLAMASQAGRDICLLNAEQGRDAALFFLSRLYEKSPAATGGVRPGPSLWESAP